jgi:hypothetical protein
MNRIAEDKMPTGTMAGTPQVLLAHHLKRASAICLTASKPIAPIQIASFTAKVTISIGIASNSRRIWMNSRLPLLPMRASRR